MVYCSEQYTIPNLTPSTSIPDELQGPGVRPQPRSHPEELGDELLDAGGDLGDRAVEHVGGGRDEAPSPRRRRPCPRRRRRGSPPIFSMAAAVPGSVPIVSRGFSLAEELREDHGRDADRADRLAGRVDGADDAGDLGVDRAVGPGETRSRRGSWRRRSRRGGRGRRAPTGRSRRGSSPFRARSARPRRGRSGVSPSAGCPVRWFTTCLWATSGARQTASAPARSRARSVRTDSWISAPS